MPMSSHTQPSTVPESVLKKRKRDEQWAAQKAAAAADAKKASEAKREEIASAPRSMSRSTVTR